ncbi:MAG: SpoIIE family protein phosphatase [Acidobacteriaceae bacterium]
MSPNKRKSASEHAAPDVQEAAPGSPRRPAATHDAPTQQVKRDAKSAGVSMSATEHHAYEGDYRPASGITLRNEPRIDAVQGDFLTRLADALNTTLDLQTLLHRVADLVRAVIEYRIFAILLLNDRTNELRMRFQIGHSADVERMRIRVGQGVVGQVAERREAMLINDVSVLSNYIDANSEVRSELAVPLVTKNRVIGVIDIQSEQPNFFRPEHLHLLQLTASRVAIAVENARLYTRISRQAQSLELLHEISRELTSILDPEQLLERVGKLLQRVIPYQMFAIWMLDEKTNMLIHRFSIRFGKTDNSFSEPVPLQRGLIGAAVSTRQTITVGDVRTDPRYILVHAETRSEMAVPLIYKGKVLGVLDLEHTRPHFFSEDNVHAVSTLAAQLAIAMENAGLYQRLAQEEQRLEEDLAMARKVQFRLMPQAVPVPLHAELAARFVPARTIGGDLYDFLDYGDGRTAIVLGDVSGKAAAAALYAALVSGIMRSLAAQKPTPAQMLALLNEQLQERKLDAQYVTMLFAIWNDNDKTLQVANAGACQPLFCRAKGVEAIQATGIPLGMFPDVEYEEFTLSTQPGDMLVFYSDGMIDAENDRDEMFDMERLTAVLEKHRQCSASTMVANILKEVSDFQGTVEHFDDETVIALRVIDPKKPVKC